MIVPLPLKPITLEQRIHYLHTQAQLVTSLVDLVNKEIVAIQEEINCIAREKLTIS